MEREFLAWLAERLPAHPQLRLGPGDDAAILDLSRQPHCVVTTDLLTDGVDFRLSEVNPKRIGRKALAVNLSDLAAMAARPLAAFVSLALPREGAFELACQLYQGLLPVAERCGLAIAGGDTNTWDGGLVIGVTAIGEVTARGPLLRSGAKPGDTVLVTGELGGSILGKHFDFEPRVDQAIDLHERYDLRAGMDLSDGLSLDLARMAAASDCGAVLNLAAVPIAGAAMELSTQQPHGRSPLEHALSDGEDFELLLAARVDEAARMVSDRSLDVPVTIIGEFVQQRGLWARDEQGRVTELQPRGYEH